MTLPNAFEDRRGTRMRCVAHPARDSEDLENATTRAVQNQVWQLDRIRATRLDPPETSGYLAAQGPDEDFGVTPRAASAHVINRTPDVADQRLRVPRQALGRRVLPDPAVLDERDRSVRHRERRLHLLLHQQQGRPRLAQLAIRTASRIRSTRLG